MAISSLKDRIQQTESGSNVVPFDLLLGQSGGETVKLLSIAQLVPWSNDRSTRQPFALYPPAKMAELAADIAENGVLQPVIVRPFGDAHQILAGHNRVAAAQMAGLATVPCIVKLADDVTAVRILTSTNLNQRDTLLPSEKAMAYKLRMDTERRQGQRSDLTSGQVVQKSTAERIGQDAGDSGKTVQRYIRLASLNPVLLELADAETIPFMAGVTVAALDEGQQADLAHCLVKHQVKRLSLEQAQALVAERDTLDADAMLDILALEQAAPARPKHLLTIKLDMGLSPGKNKAMAADPVLLERLEQVVEEYLLLW